MTKAKTSKKMWIVLHTYECGHEVIPHKNKSDAIKTAAAIAFDYAKGEDGGAFGEETSDAIKEAFGKADYALVLSIIEEFVCDYGWDGCNIELLHEEVK